MPTFKVIMFMQLADQGWTETYYREDVANIEAAAFFPGVLATPWSSIHPPSVILKSIRASLVGSPNISFLRRYDLAGAPRNPPADNEPDMDDTSALVTYHNGAGNSRRTYIRGLRDAWTVRRSDGVYVPAPPLTLACQQYALAIAGLGWGWMRTTPAPRPPAAGAPVALATATRSANNVGWTTFTVQPGGAVPSAVGNQVILARINKHLLPGANGHFPVVAIGGTTTFDVPLLFRGATVTVNLSQGNWRPYVSTFTAFTTGEFSGVVEHKTGRPSGVPRGRSRSPGYRL